MSSKMGLTFLRNQRKNCHVPLFLATLDPPLIRNKYTIYLTCKHFFLESPQKRQRSSASWTTSTSAMTSWRSSWAIATRRWTWPSPTWRRVVTWAAWLNGWLWLTLGSLSRHRGALTQINYTMSWKQPRYGNVLNQKLIFKAYFFIF